MESLPSLFATDNEGSRYRLASLLNSLFCTNGAEILAHFGQYLPAYLSLLNSQSNDSILCADLTQTLINSVLSNTQPLDDESIYSILEYFYQYIEQFPKNSKFDAFIVDFADVQMIKSAILFLLSKAHVVPHLPILLKLLPKLQDESFVKILSDCQTEAQTILISDPMKYIPSLVSCLKFGVPSVPAFASQLILLGAQRSPAVNEALIAFSPIIQSLMNSPLESDAKSILKYIYAYQSKRKPQSCLSEDEPIRLAKCLTERSEFENVDFTSANKSMSQKTTIRKRTKEAILAAVQAIHEDEPRRINVDELSGNSATKSQSSREGNKGQAEILSSFAFKLGGFRHMDWQKRFLEFYPQNKCMVWRKEQQTDGIKGVLFIDDTVQIAKNVTKDKSRQYRLLITPKPPKKSHEIAFESADVFQIWFNALSGASHPN